MNMLLKALQARELNVSPLLVQALLAQFCDCTPANAYRRETVRMRSRTLYI
jgi:hypothetical protein